MKKIAYFACEIDYALFIHSWNKDLDENLKRFAQLLEQIRIESGADELILSFFQKNNPRSYLFECIDMLEPYINGITVKLGRHCNVYDSSNISRSSISSEIKERVRFLQSTDEVVWLGYATYDIPREIVYNLIRYLPEISSINGFSYSSDKVELDNIISKTSIHNLSGLIDSIENYLNFNKHDSSQNNKQTSQQQPIMLSSEKCAYLRGKGFSVRNGYIPEEDLDFIVSIYKARDKRMDIPDDTIIKLRELITKYETMKTQSFEIASEYFLFRESIYYLMRALLHSESYKYSQKELEGILHKTSILALSLSTLPDKLQKKALERNIDLNITPEGFLAHRAVAKNRFYRLCNMHTEKTPSQILYEDAAAYHCFGCGQSGDAFGFLMNSEDITFIEAVETIAEAFDVVLSKKPKIKEKPEIVQKIFEALASDYYAQLLEKSRKKTVANYGELSVLQQPETKKLVMLPSEYYQFR